MESGEAGGSADRSGVQHGGFVHDEYELAGVHAGSHDELFHADGGAGLSQLLSAAVGIALAIAVIRGIARREQETIGNFWVDLTRTILWVLLPACLVVAMIFVSQGMIQNLTALREDATGGTAQTVTATGTDGKTTTQVVKEQKIPQGPVASQEAIKIFGTNGGGFFNANSAHPYENPTPLSEFSAARVDFCDSFGADLHAGANDRVAAARLGGVGRDGGAVPGRGGLRRTRAEARGNPLVAWSGPAGERAAAGRKHGRERSAVRNCGSALYATVTTDASCGAVNGMHDSFTPLGGMIPLINIMLGEVVFGGVGSGLYGMIVFVILSVFIAGLMVGRTPEYLGKKIEAYDVKMAMLSVLIFPLVILVFTAISVVAKSVRNAVHHKSGAARTFADFVCVHIGTGNNGSAFGGIQWQTRFGTTRRSGLRHFVREIFRGDSDSGDCGKPGDGRNTCRNRRERFR